MSLLNVTQWEQIEVSAVNSQIEGTVVLWIPPLGMMILLRRPWGSWQMFPSVRSSSPYLCARSVNRNLWWELTGPCITKSQCWKQATLADFFKPYFLQVGDRHSQLWNRNFCHNSTSLVTKKHLQNKCPQANWNSWLITMQMWVCL